MSATGCGAGFWNGFCGAEGSGFTGPAGCGEPGLASDGFGTCGETGVRKLAGGSCAAQNALAPANARAATARRQRLTNVAKARDASVKDKSEATAQGTRGQAQDMPAGSLYVVATPLGNLDDLTIRARDTLVRADRILAEDTRVTATLLAHCGIETRPTALHAHNEAKRVHDVIKALALGERVALVTDAGTPAISDPGARLVRAVHEAGHRVVPIPGPSAVVAAVSAAGLESQRFVFVGFLPSQGKQRRELLSALRGLPAALVFYEAPHRVRETVVGLAQSLGGERTLVIARELTKKFEEIARLPLAEGDAWFMHDANRVRGEFVLVVDAPQERLGAEAQLTPQIERWLAALLLELPPSAAARVVASVSGVSRDLVYERATALKARSGSEE